MSRIVQKFGGTSVGDVSRIKKVAERIKHTIDQGNQVIAVVSARAGVTNELIARASEISSNPSEREMDVLMSVGEQETIALTTLALHELGVEAVSFTGSQAGIRTDGIHTKARIRTIEAEAVEAQLNAGKAVVIAGFQGVNQHGHITTFGRGGSDLSAIAIAAVLKADLCEIFTDVDGVYTADPRVVSAAQKISEISYLSLIHI